jgi:hypothetical protein
VRFRGKKKDASGQKENDSNDRGARRQKCRSVRRTRDSSDKIAKNDAHDCQEGNKVDRLPKSWDNFNQPIHKNNDQENSCNNKDDR